MEDRLRRADELIRSLLEVAPLQDLGCAVCLEVMHLPAALPCGHTFCSSCIVRSIAARAGVAACPVCRAPFEHLPRPSATLCALVQAARPAAVAAPQAEAIAVPGAHIAPPDEVAHAVDTERGTSGPLLAPLLDCGRCAGPALVAPRCMPCGHLLCAACADTRANGDWALPSALRAVCCTACAAAPASVPRGACSLLSGWLADALRLADASPPTSASAQSIEACAESEVAPAGAVRSPAAMRVRARLSEVAFRAAHVAPSGLESGRSPRAVAYARPLPMSGAQRGGASGMGGAPTLRDTAARAAVAASGVRCVRGCDGCGLLPALPNGTRAAEWGGVDCVLAECVECAAAAAEASDVAAAEGAGRAPADDPDIAGAGVCAAAEPNALATPGAARGAAQAMAQPFGLCPRCARWAATRAAPPALCGRRARLVAGRFGSAAHDPAAHALRPTLTRSAMAHAGWRLTCGSASVHSMAGLRERLDRRHHALIDAMRGVLATAVGEFADGARRAYGSAGAFDRLAALAAAESDAVRAAGAAELYAPNGGAQPLLPLSLIHI